MVNIDLTRPMAEIPRRAQPISDQNPAVAERPADRRRDIAHAKLKERLDRGEDFPAFMVVDDKDNDFFAEFMKPGAIINEESVSDSA